MPDDLFAEIFTDPRINPAKVNEDEEYEKFVESMVPHCHCADRHRPCDGVLAGGLCDNMQDDPDHDDEPDEEY